MAWSNLHLTIGISIIFLRPYLLQPSSLPFLTTPVVHSFISLQSLVTIQQVCSAKMFTSALTILSLASAALAAVVAPMSIDERFAVKRSLSGQATYYGGNVKGGACSFSTYSLPAGLMGTALSDSNWANSANCGGCVKVNHAGKSVTAMVRTHVLPLPES